MGKAYVYGRNHGGPNNWGLIKMLQGHGTPDAVHDQFGSSVAVHGDTVVVGARHRLAREAVDATTR